VLSVPLSQGKESGRRYEMAEGMDVEKNIEDDKGYIDNPGNDEDDFNESEDDLLCSQDLEEFAKDEDLVLPPSRERKHESS
jgi:dipeptidase